MLKKPLEKAGFFDATLVNNPAGYQTLGNIQNVVTADLTASHLNVDDNEVYLRILGLKNGVHPDEYRETHQSSGQRNGSDPR